MSNAIEGRPSPPPPFSYQYSPNVPEILLGLRASLVISTYQTGKVVIFSAKDENQLIQLPRTFARPMGMAYEEGKLAIGLMGELLITSNAPGLAANYPNAPNTYDGFFVPRNTYFTGPLDIHDLAWSGNEVIAVNTLFSCLIKSSQKESFEPIWKPDFVTELKPEDRCHLNGLAMKAGKPKYVTALGQTDDGLAWKSNMLNGGVLMDVTDNEILLDNLPVPHSPRLYNDGLFMLLSATGELVRVDIETRKYEVLTKLNGFLRGMDRIGDYLFIAMSKLRPNSSLFKEAPIAKTSIACGISIVYVPTGKQVGYITYFTSVEELFDVCVLPDMIRPNIMNYEKGVHYQSIVTESDSYWVNQPKEEVTK
jgi:uncharacterized protein (TIGR03032 family)